MQLLSATIVDIAYGTHDSAASDMYIAQAELVLK
jgi:hypothetical protein